MPNQPPEFRETLNSTLVSSLIGFNPPLEWETAGFVGRESLRHHTRFLGRDRGWEGRMEHSSLSDGSHISVAYKDSIVSIQFSASLMGRASSHASQSAFSLFLNYSWNLGGLLLGPPPSSPQVLFPCISHQEMGKRNWGGWIVIGKDVGQWGGWATIHHQHDVLLWWGGRGDGGVNLKRVSLLVSGQKPMN